MKALLFLTTVLVASVPAAEAAPGLAKLAGTYRSDEGAQFVATVSGRTVTLRTNAELSRYGLCRTPLTLSSGNTSSDEEFAEARYGVSRAQCSGVDGPVTLHYNRAITGVDVYLVDVVIRQGHGRDQGQTMRWHLTKIR